MKTLIRLAVTLGAAALLLVLSMVFPPYRDYQLATVAAYVCATAGLTVLTGLNGQLSLGHGALMATGAYTVALVQNRFSDADVSTGWTLAVSLVAAVVVSLAAGAVIGLAAARLRGPYLAGATLSVAVVVPAVAAVFKGTFNGDQGLPVALAPPPQRLGLDFPNERWQAWIAVAAALVTMLLLANLAGSRYGRAFRAVRDDEVAAELAGINLARTRVLAFVVSAAGAGLGGGLLAVLAQSVAPGAFSLTLSLYLVLAIVVGGLGSLAGAVYGAVLLVALPDLATRLTGAIALSPAVERRLAGNLPLAVFGATLIAVLLVAPGGLHGLLRRLGRLIWFARRTSPHP